MNKKAQVFTIDLLVSIFLFLLLFTSVVTFLYSSADISNQASPFYTEISDIYLNNIASQAADSLVASKGYPANWTVEPCSSIYKLGLLQTSFEVSKQKLYNLTTMTDSCISSLLRSGSSFNISVTYLNGSEYKISGRWITAGYPPPSSLAYVSSIQRFMVLYPSGIILKLNYEEWFQ
ncbi:hypothetical protein M1293_03585 [Candidatus Parvarchaeota archaeon]|nr:hypothetical protein [Candidatus Parvarchaeota archaeon]